MPPQPRPSIFTVDSPAAATAASTAGVLGVGTGAGGPGSSPAKTCGRPDGASRWPTPAKTAGAGGSVLTSAFTMVDWLSGREIDGMLTMEIMAVVTQRGTRGAAAPLAGPPPRASGPSQGTRSPRPGLAATRAP